MGTLVMTGVENLAGQTTQNGLCVERLVSRRPVHWAVRCARCGCNWTEPHASVRYVKCRNQHCGQSSPTRRGSSAETTQAIPANRSRDSQSAREFRAEEAERELERHQTREREQRQYAAPVEPTTPNVVSQDLTRANDLSWGSNRDPKLYVSERMRKISMPVEEAKRWQRHQAGLFAANCRLYSYYASPETMTAILRYLADNSVMLADHEMLEAAFLKLVQEGLIRRNKQ